MKTCCFPKFQRMRKIADGRQQIKENAKQVITPCLQPIYPLSSNENRQPLPMPSI